jgi:hypothetical protein
MNLRDAVEDPGARRVLLALVERHENAPDRIHPPMFRLTPGRMPEFGERRRAGEADQCWMALKMMEEADLIHIEDGKPKVGHAPYELSPMVRFVPASFEEACRLLGRRANAPSRSMVWRQALEMALPGEDALHEAISSNWVEILGRSAPEVAQRLALLRAEKHGTFLRQVSARLFWGDSKLLDGRADLVCAVLGVKNCPFPESPVQLQVDIVNPDFHGILFVENVMVFEYMRSIARPTGGTPGSFGDSTGPFTGLALAQAHGFRGTARRIRTKLGCSIYYSNLGASCQRARERLESWFFGASDTTDSPSVFFWGDLDFAGMAILKALRVAFPGATAWEPGYAQLLKSVEEGYGHEPVAVGKENQRDPGTTGCAYADNVLLPKMREIGRFMDQEFVCLS